MNYAAKVMSRHPWTWRAWMALGTPYVAVALALALSVEAYRAMRVAWSYEFSHQVRDWFEAFGERHRLSLHSLALKPEAGGVSMHRPSDSIELCEDLGFGREFTPVHVRAREDLH